MATVILFAVGMCAGALIVPAVTLFLITAMLTIGGVIAPDPAAGVITDERP